MRLWRSLVCVCAVGLCKGLAKIRQESLLVSPCAWSSWACASGGIGLSWQGPAVMQQDLGREKGKPIHCCADILEQGWGLCLEAVGPGKLGRISWEVMVSCLFDPLSQPGKTLTSNNPHSLQAWIRQGTHHWLQLPQVVELPPQGQEGSPGLPGV